MIIYNIIGGIVKEIETTNITEEINLSGFSKGMYIVNIKNSGKSLSKKINTWLLSQNKTNYIKFFNNFVFSNYKITTCQSTLFFSSCSQYFWQKLLTSTHQITYKWWQPPSFYLVSPTSLKELITQNKGSLLLRIVRKLCISGN